MPVFLPTSPARQSHGTLVSGTLPNLARGVSRSVGDSWRSRGPGNIPFDAGSELRTSSVVRVKLVALVAALVILPTLLGYVAASRALGSLAGSLAAEKIQQEQEMARLRGVATRTSAALDEVANHLRRMQAVLRTDVATPVAE